MSARHGFNWPSSSFTTRRVDSAAQIQYIIGKNDNQSVDYVTVNAINIFQPSTPPYEWSKIPRHLERVVSIMAWIQWAFSECYLETKKRRKILGCYIIYMEQLLDTLWEAVDSKDVKKWEADTGSPWVQIQKYGRGFHSEKHLEKSLAVGSILAADLRREVEDWVLEAQNIEDIGFPGSQIYRKGNGRFDSISLAEKQSVLEELMKNIEVEEQGKQFTFNPYNPKLI
jgi:hypothetical protein